MGGLEPWSYEDLSGQNGARETGDKNRFGPRARGITAGCAREGLPSSCVEIRVRGFGFRWRTSDERRTMSDERRDDSEELEKRVVGSWRARLFHVKFCPGVLRTVAAETR